MLLKEDIYVASSLEKRRAASYFGLLIPHRMWPLSSDGGVYERFIDFSGSIIHLFLFHRGS
jgi:hypothetical protein